MRTQESRGSGAGRVRCLVAIIVGLTAVASIEVGSSAAAKRGHSIGLAGDAALLDRHTKDSTGKEDYAAVVRVASSFSDMQNVTVDFKIMQGGTLVDEGTQTAGVRPGGGVVYADFLEPKAGKAGVRYTVKAGIQSLAPGFADDALAAAKIVGRPKFIRDTPTCGMSARVRNASKKVLSESTEIYLVGLRMGKIVAFGPAGLFDDLAPGATKAIADRFHDVREGRPGQGVRRGGRHLTVGASERAGRSVDGTRSRDASSAYRPAAPRRPAGGRRGATVWC